MLSKPSDWLAGRLVVELGGRIAVGACGSLLAEAGATVVFVEPRDPGQATGKFADRPLFASRKRSLAVDPDDPSDQALVAALVARADIVLTSSDWDFLGGLNRMDVPPQVTVCNITALGPRCGRRGLTEPEVQALTGVAYSSGFPDAGPTVLRIPVLEYSAAVFAAAACVAAFGAMRESGAAQRIEVSLFNCAIHLLAAFLPPVFQGEEPGRYGNGHPLAAPWNAYPTRDGWILFCSASDVQWQKFCELIGRPELAVDPRYRRIADRAKNRGEVDAIVSDWTRRFEAAACLESLAQVGLAGGEIVSLQRLPDEANVRHRRTIVREIRQGLQPSTLLPADVLTTTLANRQSRSSVPAPDADRAWLTSAALQPIVRKPEGAGRPRLPLEGVRVIEIGQYTTAPLSARHLAMYGADICKIEPPLGDAARAWAPLVDGISVFFSISNSGKTCYTVDLKSPQGLGSLEELIRSADVLVENLKPGSLAALGLGPDRLRALNPQIVYCSISGFGHQSAYPGRPAFDTVVQAMSGIMDANTVGGMPLKAGVSVCDVMGGQMALFAIMAALYHRETSGRGADLDLSMQDIAIWVTARLWNGEIPEQQFGRMLACRDGHVLSRDGELPATLDLAALDRVDAVRKLAAAGVMSVPVRTIREALESEDGKQLAPLDVRRLPDGSAIPLLAPPLEMAPLALQYGNPPGKAIALERLQAAQ